MPIKQRVRPRYYWRPPQVEPDFRDEVLEVLTRRGMKADDVAILRLVAYRYFATFREVDTGYAVAPYEMLSRLEGKHFDGKHYNPDTFLKRANAVLGGMEMTEPAFTSGSLYGGRARTIRSLGCDDELQPIIQKYLLREHSQRERVALDTGVPWTKGTRKVAIAEEAAFIAETISGVAPNDASELIARYILSLEAYRETFFAKVNENYFAAQGKLLSLYRPLETDGPEQILNKKRRHQAQQAVLDSVVTYPVPFARYGRKTSRLAIANKGYLNLRREVYKELVTGWETYDGKAMQLAIVARLWGITELQSFLQAGGNIWETVCRDLDISLSRKPILKAAVYKLLFGARLTTGSDDEADQKAAVLSALDKELGSGFGRKFISHRLLRPLVRARAQMRQQVKRDGGVNGAFGWVALEKGTKRLPSGHIADTDNWRSVLAQQAQSYEVLLIAECYKVAEQTSDFLIGIYRYDGFTTIWREKRPERRQKCIAALKAAFKAKADEYGICTELVEE